MPSTDQPRDQLAIHGGRPAIPDGPPWWPLLDEDIRAALQAAYADGSWGRYDGPHCQRAEQMLAEQHGVKFAMLCSSGTFAVELALRGLKIGDGDEVILAGYDFSGNFRSIEAVGAKPVLVDILPGNWCLDPAEVKSALGERTRAIIVSHLHGSAAPMRALARLAGQNGLAIVEDACQAHGAVVDGRTAGTWGDIGVLSFGGSKLVTAGRGGAIVLRHNDAYQRAKVYCRRGNNAFPMSELQAAVLPAQLDKLARRNSKRGENVQRLLAGLEGQTALTPRDDDSGGSQPCYYKLGWLYNASGCGGHSRDEFLAAAQAEGVAVDAGFLGFTRRPESRCRRVGALGHSKRACDATVLLHHPVLLESPEIIDQVAAALRKVITVLSGT